MKRLLIAALITLAGLALLGALSAALSCTTPPSPDLTFDTIEKEQDPKILPAGVSEERVHNLEIYDEIDAKVYVVTSDQDELLGADRWISVPAQEAIAAVDFSRYFVVIALQGYRGHNQTGVEIRRIWQEKDTVYVRAHFTEVIPGGGAGMMVSSPYHIVRVTKKGMAQFGNLTFVLLDESARQRARATYQVP